ncbi:MAG: hypothetical protein AB3N24_20340, partial [Leisingera sp.]
GSGFMLSDHGIPAILASGLKTLENVRNCSIADLLERHDFQMLDYMVNCPRRQWRTKAAWTCRFWQRSPPGAANAAVPGGVPEQGRVSPSAHAAAFRSDHRSRG